MEHKLAVAGFIAVITAFILVVIYKDTLSVRRENIPVIRAEPDYK